MRKLPHEQAVLHAEVRRLVHALAPYGVLPRAALERKVKAACWHEASFERALQTAVEEGQIVELPFGFYALPHSNGAGGDSAHAA